MSVKKMQCEKFDVKGAYSVALATLTCIKEHCIWES